MKQSPEFEIAGRKVGQAHPPLVIAEVGINHGGDLEVAKGMVRMAAQAGCEIIKHQTHILEDEMTEEAKAIFPPNADVSIWDVMARCALSLEEEAELKEYSESLGLIWISTPFSRAAADFLEELEVPAFKIGSGEADNLALIRHIARKDKPVILSTGMQSIETLRASVQILEDAGIPYALLECTNLYPSPPEIVSLRGVSELREAFPRAVVGFSDHSIGPEMALASVALGASILERHFTDTRYRQGPDIINSMEPAELRFLIDRSREIWVATNNPKRRTELEEPVYRFARASVVADADLPEGHVIGENDIWARRPGSGEIPGYDFDKVIGDLPPEKWTILRVREPAIYGLKGADEWHGEDIRQNRLSGCCERPRFGCRKERTLARSAGRWGSRSRAIIAGARNMAG